MFNRMTSLWMGDLDPYMDEAFIKQAFSTMGETAYGIKIITHKLTGGSAGYCFVEMADEASVDRCVHRLNGKILPGSIPPRKFKLNYATYGKRPETGPEFSVFVGDLSSDVDDYQLQQFFSKKYPSCKGAKVVTDQFGNSKGYGFVKFTDENEQKKSIEECQNSSSLGAKPIRLSIAVSKSQKMNNYNQGQQHGYHNNYNQHQYYQQPGQNYYPQWGYDQYNGYGSGYNGYNYNYGPFGYPPAAPQGMMGPPPPLGLPPMLPDMTAAAEQTQEAEESEEEPAEEPNPPLDVEVLNSDYMERSEELYDALMNCYWQPLDSIFSCIPSSSSPSSSSS